MCSLSSRAIATMAASLALVSSQASASGLQVQPVSIEIVERSGIIWLSNTSDQPLQVQARIHRWKQETGADELGPAGEFIVSPPIASIAPGGRQLVRLVPSGAASCEDSYRLSIDEIPPVTSRGPGLRYVLHYSVPVFVRLPGCASISPDLDWQLSGNGASSHLVVTNKGTMHAQLARVTFTDARGRDREVSPGLLGYVLPGATRKFATALAPDAAAGSGTLKAVVNGTPVSRRVASTPAPR